MSPLHAVIIAGGAGTRFWPASRAAHPKQLLSLVGDDSLLRATVNRLAARVPHERMVIATGAHLVEATASALPEIPRRNILAEPAPRNTAPCIAWATATILRAEPEAVVAVFPADHFIADEAGFVASLDRAVESAQRGYITTIGVVPTRPETGYGYIETGEELSPGLRDVVRFVEKPDLALAERYVAGGKHLWNAGMFFFQGKLMMDAVREHLPEVAAAMAALDAAAARGDEAAALANVFPTLPSVSIDVGIMEKERRLAVVPATFTWNDVGSWLSCWELAPHDAAKNAVPEGTVAVDARGNLVWDRRGAGPKRTYALLGVSDLVLVETDDAVLVLPRDRAQDVRAIVDALRAAGRTDLL